MIDTSTFQGKRAAYYLAENVARDCGPGQILLYKAGLDVIRDRGGIRQRCEYGQGYRHSLARQRGYDEVVMIPEHERRAILCILKHTEGRNKALHAREEQYRHGAKAREHKAAACDRLTNV